MPSFLHAAFLASIASAADITTSIWLPGAANANQSFVGSVVEQNGDQTVLSLAFANAVSTPGYFTSAPDRVTVGGTTFVAYNVSATDSAGPNAAAVTIELECRRPSGGISAVPTCTLSTLGANSVLGNVCAGLSVTQLPEYCTASSAVNVEETQTFSGESQYYINNYPLLITAGTEKLGASAAATPSAGSASITGAGTSGGAAPSQSGSRASVPPQQATGAAQPMRTMAPALLGLGAAAGALFL
ncbi:hypothetical protein IQ06DRAFT_333123 [Phaeosphaeriaceae sp. SRC1lsM3a]|nr:hypothetical protein IQ06DRAFT_333123 [Stagonospora sp. SRC1lsM3a]